MKSQQEKHGCKTACKLFKSPCFVIQTPQNGVPGAAGLKVRCAH